jgi:hypothetical protein
MATMTSAQPRLDLAARPPVPEPTLEDSLLRVWEELRDQGHSSCPVCQGTLIPEACLDCGAKLE